MKPPRRPMLPRRPLLLAGLAAAAGPWATAQAEPVAVGELVPWPSVSLLDGEVLTPAQWRGQAVVVVFFETTCPFCRRHNPHVEKLHQRMRGQGLRVLAAAQDHDPERVRAYLREHRYSFPVTLDSAPLRAVLSQRRVIPLTCVVDRVGRLREVIPGEMFEEDVLELAKWATAG